MSNEGESTPAFDFSRLAESLKEEMGRLLDQKLEPMNARLGRLEELQSSLEVIEIGGAVIDPCWSLVTLTQMTNSTMDKED